MDFVPIPAGTHELGWRFTADLPSNVTESLSGFLSQDDLVGKMSIHRRVALPGFDIAVEAVSLADIVGDPYELDEEVSTIAGLCDLIDARLHDMGWRLPTEDEFEAACGGSLFPWGMKVPDGIPYEAETTFEAHRGPNAFGLVLNADPYQVEVVRHALKMGDGGCSICGGDPWPMAWLSLSPRFRLLDDDVADCFTEILEEAWLRPVRLHP